MAKESGGMGLSTRDLPSPAARRRRLLLRAVRSKVGLALALLLCVLAACRAGEGEGVWIVVASATSPRQQLLGQMTVLALRAAGYQVRDRTGLGDPWVVRAALEQGTVDLAWQDTGEAWLDDLGHDLRVADAEVVHATLRAEDVRHGLTWLAKTSCEHQLALFVAQGIAETHNIVSLTDLSAYMRAVNPDLSVCVPDELLDAPEGLRGLSSVYGLRFRAERIRLMPIAEGYAALARRTCDCAMGYSDDFVIVGPDGPRTDPGKSTFQWCGTPDLSTPLQVRRPNDDRSMFQASSLAPVLRTAVLERLPDLERTMGRLSRALTEEAWCELRRRVEVDGAKPQSVARAFLSRQGMLRPGWTR